MVDSATIFSDRKLVVAIQKFYFAIEEACLMIGDISLKEYVILVAMGELASGFPLNGAKTKCDTDNDSNYCALFLEEKELAVRVRNSNDRRGFALSITAKGRARLNLIDNTISKTLISRNPNWSEAEFEYLVSKAHALPSIYPNTRITTILSSEFLVFLQKYHQALTNVAAYYGMTSSQIAILCAYENSENLLSLEYVQRLHGNSNLVIEFLLEDLEKKTLIDVSHCVEITQKGQQRIKELTREVAFYVSDYLDKYSEHEVSLYEELCEHLVYMVK